VGVGQRLDKETANAQRNADRMLDMVRLQAQQDAQRDASQQALQGRREAMQFQGQQAEASRAGNLQAIQAQIQGRKDLFDYELTAQQKQLTQQLNDAEHWVNVTPLNPEQRQQFRLAIAAQRAGIKAVPVPKAKPKPFPNGKVLGELFTDPLAPGVLLTMNDKGYPVAVHEPKEPKEPKESNIEQKKAEYLMKLAQARDKVFIDLVKLEDGVTGKPRFTVAEAEAEAYKRYPRVDGEQPETMDLFESPPSELPADPDAALDMFLGAGATK
jgi:hypothetical protein